MLPEFFLIRRFLPVLFALPLILVLNSCNIPTSGADTRNAINQTGQAIDGFFGDIEDSLDSERNDLLDPTIGVSRDEYRRDFLGNAAPTVQDTPPDPILPDVSSLLIEPRPPLIGQDKLVTLSVTEEVPLKEVILELARRADVDVEIDPGIRGGIIFRAKDKPFSDVIERIANLSGLRYSIRDGVLKVERDTAYVVNYNVNVLNMTREGSKGININTQVLSAGGGDSDSFSSGSDVGVNAAFTSDVWDEIDTTVNNIINNFSGNVTTFSPSAGAGASAATDDLLGAEPTSDSGNGAQGDESALLSINKQLGLVSVLASEKQHREIKAYLDYVTRSRSSQVLIEAKILEVDLDDNYRAGINWQDLRLPGLKDIAFAGNFDSSVSGTDDIGDIFTIDIEDTDLFGIKDFNLDTLVSLAQRFGVTRTLSNPRIAVLNNEQAVLTFAENFVYFDIDISQEETTTGTTTENQLDVESDPVTVPIGVILALQPSIDLDKNELTLNIRPTVSRIKDTVEDPGVTLIAQDLGLTSTDVVNFVPKVEVRELDTVVRIKSGQIVVIGGLIDQRIENEDNGVPGFSEIPFIGNAFKSVEKTNSVVETVVFVKATIIPGYGVSEEDKRFYRKYSSDSRPTSF